MPRRLGHVQFGIAIAIVIGAVVAAGLTAFFFLAKGESFEACMIREMKGQPEVNALKVQRACANRHGVNLGY